MHPDETPDRKVDNVQAEEGAEAPEIKEKTLEKIYKIGDSINKWLKKARHLSKAKVISIGNLTTGGTGKTPATIYFARLLANDYRLGILTRGYGGTASKTGAVLTDGEDIFINETESGDEPRLLAVNLRGVPIGVGRNRYKMGEILKKEFDIDLFLLDDGFQHYALHRDVDIVLIDAVNPFGNRHVIPHGILREPLEALQRADIVIMTKCDLADSVKVEELSAELQRLSGHEMVFRSRHAPVGLVKLPVSYKDRKINNIKREKLSVLNQETVWALSGIGNHRSFENMLKNLGVSRIESISFRDHHEYTEKDVDNILKRVSPYDYLITTEKDWVRLSRFADKFRSLKRFYFLKIEFEILNHEILLKEGLKAKIMTGKTDQQG